MTTIPTDQQALTHEKLVQRARRWLAGSKGCYVVGSHRNIVTWEQPDSIGWNCNGVSILVECKVSRSDYFRDEKKMFRKHPSVGMGNLRYYLTPPKLIRVEELPENWGLLECLPKTLRIIRKATHLTDKNRIAETQYLLSMIAGNYFQAEFQINDIDYTI